MKIMTYNIVHCWNVISKVIEYPKLADVIKKYDPDIVGMNEVRHKGEIAGEYENQVGILSDLTNIPYNFFAKAIELDGGHNPYGNGMLSKLPIMNAEVIEIPDPDPKTGTVYYETRCLLKAKLEGGITVLITHFGLNPDEQENAVETVLANLEDKKCILMGDFNITPDNPLIAKIKEKMKDVADITNNPLYSWPSDAPNMKIDYIFVSPDIEVTATEVPVIECSDHCPHIATIEFK